MNKSNQKKFRHEMKYVISVGELEMLKNRLNHMINIDSHAGENGIYNIRSLYFDDYYNRGIREIEDGTDPREKFRIRIYNHSSEHIRLECKRKERGKTFKTSCPLTFEQTKTLMSGRTIGNIGEQPLLLQKFTYQMLARKLHPVIIVEYDRIPYIYKNGNVRITLDTNISSSTDIGGFFEENIAKRPVMPSGHQLLEVKYDEYLPDFIYHNLQLQSLKQTAFSKYYMCRKFKI